MNPFFESALTQTRSALELDRPFDDLTLSVFLKYLLVAHLESAFGSVSGFRTLPPAEHAIALEEIAAGAFERVGPLLDEVAASLQDDSRFQLSPGLLESLPERSAYAGGIARLAVEQFTSERLAPELRLAPRPLSPGDRAAALPGRVNLCVLFDAFTNFTNELYPLIVDALEHDYATRGGPVINVLGVQAKWWNGGGTVDRAIFLRPGDHALIESELDPPLRPDAALFLCMDRRIHSTLAQKAGSLPLVQINPYKPVSEIADDKFDCFRRWSASGVATPDAVLLPRSVPERDWGTSLAEKKTDWEKDGAGVVVQPNHGTEGRGAEYLPPGTGVDKIREYADRLGRDDDVLVRKEIRGLYYLPEEGKEPVPCDLRINVTRDGTTWYAESGCLQVATDPSTPITSAGRGGRIVKFSGDPFNRLVAWDPEGFRPVRLCGNDYEHIRAVSIAAARSLGETGLIGIDLRLVPLSRKEERSVEAFVLDANPRPAGLSQSEFLPEAGRVPEPGVSRRLWDRLRLD